MTLTTTALSLPGAAVLALAGLGAGAINAVVGSGTLITFPTLLALGFDPLVANVSNNLGLVPGAVASALGYRQELVGERPRLLRLGGVCALGGALGAMLLLWLPERAFSAIVPVFVALAVLVVAFQPWLARWIGQHRGAASGLSGSGRSERAALPWLFIAGVYGGYFGAAQGIAYIAILGLTLSVSLQRVNALKNVLGATVNSVAAVCFIASGAHLDYAAVGIIAVGATAGGFLGARFGRRLPASALRALIVTVGVVAFWQLVG